MTFLIPLLAQAPVDAASLPKLLTILGCAIALLLVMIIWMRLQAFVALILISVLVAIAAGFSAHRDCRDHHRRAWGRVSASSR